MNYFYYTLENVSRYNEKKIEGRKIFNVKKLVTLGLLKTN